MPPTKDDGGNVVAGHRRVRQPANLIRSDGPRVAAIGVDDLVIIATSDAVLVVPRVACAARPRGRGMV